MSSDSSDTPTYEPTRIPVERPGREGGTRHANRLARTRELCEAGLRCFLEGGLDGVAIDDVVKRAGTAKGTFYRYFDSKEALVAAIFGPVGARVIDALDRCVAAVEAADRPEDLDAAYAALTAELLALLPDHLDTVRLYLQERHGPPTSARAAVHELDAAILERAVRMTEAGIRSGLLVSADPRLVAGLVVGGVHELLRQLLLGQWPDDPLGAAGDLVRVVLHGIRARPAVAD